MAGRACGAAREMGRVLVLVCQLLSRPTYHCCQLVALVLGPEEHLPHVLGEAGADLDDEAPVARDRQDGTDAGVHAAAVDLVLSFEVELRLDTRRLHVAHKARGRLDASVLELSVGELDVACLLVEEAEPHELWRACCCWA